MLTLLEMNSLKSFYIHGILFIISLLCVQDMFACGVMTTVSSQKQFDDVVERINKGELMQVVLRKGKYVLKTPIHAKAPLCIKGEKATITCYNSLFEKDKAIKSEGGFWVYKRGSVTPYSLFYDSNGGLVDVSESVNEYTRVNLVEEGILAEKRMDEGTIVRIPITSDLKHLSNRVFQKAFGYFDCGWQTVNFLLEKSDDSYFYCKTINYCRTGNYSYDRVAYNRPIRYVIYNAELKPRKIYYDNDFVYIPKTFDVIYQLDFNDNNTTKADIVVMSDFVLRGVSFMGFNGIDVKIPVTGDCRIENCTFENCLGCALKIKKGAGAEGKMAVVKNCTFVSCSLLTGNVISVQCVVDRNPSVSINKNVICRYPCDRVGYKNVDGAVYIDGDAVVNDNIVYNTCRDHLYFNRGLITARGNWLYNSDVFNAHDARNTANDWGLIYCNHLFNDPQKGISNKDHIILIENNILYGANSYCEDARGIFIDDGRGDVTCKNNIILNSQSYSIDSRVISTADASSVRNRFEGNIISSEYRLEAGSLLGKSDLPIAKGNILLSHQSNNITSTQGTQAQENDVKLELLSQCYVNDNKMCVQKELFGLLKKSPAWKDVKKYFNKR